MQRIDLIKGIAPLVTAEDLCISSIGGLWDDWWNYRPPGDNTFFPGILGSITTTALGLALALPHRRIIAFETDGSVLMNLGGLTTLARYAPPNLTHLVFDNESLLSVGGFPTATATGSDLAGIARAAGITHACEVRELDEFRQVALARAEQQAKHPKAGIDPEVLRDFREAGPREFWPRWQELQRAMQARRSNPGPVAPLPDEKKK